MPNLQILENQAIVKMESNNKQLPELLEIGEQYWVPCLKAPDELQELFQENVWMPVFATAHVDSENLFREMNRITAGQLAKHLSPVALNLYNFDNDESEGFRHFHIDIRFTKYEYAHGSALPALATSSLVWQQKKCLRLPADYYANSPVPLIYQAGCQNMQMTDRYVCPHQQLSLRGVPVNSAGEVVCPAHGLKWCTKTGSLIPRAERAFEYYAIAYQPLMYEREILVREALGIQQPDWTEVIWERLPEPLRVYFDRSTFDADLASWGNT